MEYEAKMSSMEDMWQKQMSSLQLSLAAAKKSLATDEFLPQTPGKHDNGRISAGKHRHSTKRQLLPSDDEEFDWDDVATNGMKSPDDFTNKYLVTGSGNGASRGDVEAARSVVSHLTREYDHRTQVFNDDVDFLIEVKSGLTEANLNPEEELRKLKVRFDTWRRDFKARLRETRLVLNKLCSLDSAEKDGDRMLCALDSLEKEGDRTRKKWWGKKTTSSRALQG